MTLYARHGVVVASELDLGDGRVDGGVVDLRVVDGGTRAVAAERPDGELLAGRPLESDRAYWLVARGDGVLVLRFPGVAEFTIDMATSTVTSYPAPDTSPGLVAILLDGNVVNIWLMLQGALPLHASAVELDGVAVAICGRSGSGKSTLAAQLCANGARLITDDLLRVEMTATGVRCFPGGQRLRLRSQAAPLADALAGDRAATPDGRQSVRPHVMAHAPHELRLLLWPAFDDDAVGVRFQAMSRADTWNALTSTPRMGGLRSRKLLREQFELNGTLAERVRSEMVVLPCLPAPSGELGRSFTAGVRSIVGALNG